MPTLVSAKQALLGGHIYLIHDGTWGSPDTSIFFNHGLTKVRLAEPVARFVEGDRLDVDVCHPVIRPEETWIVINFPEGGIQLAVVVDAGEYRYWGARAQKPNVNVAASVSPAKLRSPQPACWRSAKTNGLPPRLAINAVTPMSRPKSGFLEIANREQTTSPQVPIA